MATSGSTDFSVTRNQLITGALRLVGGVAQGETPTSDQITEAAEALNMLVKAWQAVGMPLWAMKQYTMSLTTSTSSYTIGVGSTVNTAKPLRVVSAYLHNIASGIDVPMTLLTREEYNSLGNKTSTGDPIQFFYEPLLTTGVVHLFPVPDSVAATDYTILLVYQRPFEDFDASTDTPDFPQEWYNALKYGLADMLSFEYGVDIQTAARLTSIASREKDLALSNGTEEGSFYFKVESRKW